MRSKLSSLSSTTITLEGSGVLEMVCIILFLIFPLAHATFKILSHCFSFSFEMTAMSSTAFWGLIGRPSQVSKWSPQFALEYLLSGFLRLDHHTHLPPHDSTLCLVQHVCQMCGKIHGDRLLLGWNGPVLPLVSCQSEHLHQLLITTSCVSQELQQ